MLEPKIFKLFLPLLILAQASADIGPFHRSQPASVLTPSRQEPIPSQTESSHHVYKNGRHTATGPYHSSLSTKPPLEARSSEPKTPRTAWRLSNAAWSSWSSPNVSTDSPVEILSTVQYSKPQPVYVLRDSYRNQTPSPPVTPIPTEKPIEQSNVQIDTANFDRDPENLSTDTSEEIRTTRPSLSSTQQHPVEKRLMETGPYHRPPRSSDPWDTEIFPDDSIYELRTPSELPTYNLSHTTATAGSHFSCPQPHGYFKQVNKCNEYVECKNYAPLKFACPAGLHFNPDVQWTEYPCAHPSKVQCEEKPATIAPPPATRAPNVVSTPRPNHPQSDYICPEPHGYYKHTDDCGQYVECKNYVPLTFICPNGLHFNPIVHWTEYPCAHPSKVQCKKEPIVEVTTRPTPPPTTRPPPTTTRRPPPTTTRRPPPPPPPTTRRPLPSTTRRPPPPPPTTRRPPPPPPTTRRPPPPPPTTRRPPPPPPTTRRPPPPPPTTRRPPPPPTTRRPSPPPTTRRPPPPPPTTRRPPPPPTTRRPPPPPPTTRRPTPPPTTRRPLPPTTRRPPPPPPTTTRRPPPPIRPPPLTTSTPPTTTLGPSHICPEPHGYFKITFECDKYVECKNYMPLMFTCPIGLHFNHLAKWTEYPCVHPSKVQCNAETEIKNPPVIPAPTTVAPAVTTPLPGNLLPDFKCPQPHGYFKHAESCSEYIECKNHQPLQYACPIGLHFNSLVHWTEYPCDEPSKVQCNKEPGVTSQPLDYRPPTAPQTTTSRTTVTTTAVTSYIPHSSTQMPVSYPERPLHQLDDFYCQDPNAYYSVASQCDVYIECKSYIAVQHFCPVGLHFNSKVQWPNYPCDYPSKAQCNKGQVIHDASQHNHDSTKNPTEILPPRLVTVSTRPQRPAVEKYQTQRPVVVSTQPQRPAVVNNRPQRPTVVKYQTQRPVVVSTRPQRPTLEKDQTQRPVVVSTRPQRPAVVNHRPQRPTVEKDQTQHAVETTRPQLPTVATHPTQRPAIESHKTLRPQRPAVVTSRPQPIHRNATTTPRYSNIVKPYTPNYPTHPTLAPINPKELFGYKCPETNGFYGVSSQCDVYVECKNDIAIQYTCPDGLHFNPRANWPDYPCGYPSEVKCNSGDNVQKANPTDDCPHSDGFFPANTDDCGLYIVCHAGVSTLEHCPEGLVFNFDKDVCDWPINVPECNKPRALEGFVCPATPTGEDGFIYKYRYGRSCKEFVACQEEQPRLLSCDSGLYFDEKTESCVDPELVGDCDA